jgi:hypothetical protein
MKFILLAIIAACLTSCAGLNLSLSSPWGDIESLDGHTVVIPRPVIVPSK